MTLGPHDRRIQQLRCSPCARSHLKCSGRRPCTNCQRRNRECLSISGSGKLELCIIPYQSETVEAIKNVIQQVQPLVSLSKDERWLSYLFVEVLPKTNFSGRAGSFSQDLQDMIVTSNGLREASVAFSAMFAHNHAATRCESVSIRHSALQAYQSALASVKASIEEPLSSLVPTLWAVFLLSMFELMTDASGQNWVHHMLQGISRVLESCGPHAMRTGQFRQYYLEVRVYEICRALIFSETTYLSRPEWRQLSRSIWLSSHSIEWHPNEDLLDLMVSISELRHQTLNFLFNGDFKLTQSHPQSVDQLRIYAAEGLRLRLALTQWRATVSQYQPSSILRSSPMIATRFTVPEDQHIIGELFYAAISIYLSGIFDYHRQFWDGNKVDIPTLPPYEIEEHVATIVSVTSSALAHSAHSGILFFFPLRVAGARSHCRQQRQEIRDTLVKISSQYVVAASFVDDLDQHWNE